MLCLDVLTTYVLARFAHIQSVKSENHSLIIKCQFELKQPAEKPCNYTRSPTTLYTVEISFQSITLIYSLSTALKSNINYHTITLKSITMPMNCLTNNFCTQTPAQPHATCDSFMHQRIAFVCVFVQHFKLKFICNLLIIYYNVLFVHTPNTHTHSHTRFCIAIRALTHTHY